MSARRWFSKLAHNWLNSEAKRDVALDNDIVEVEHKNIPRCMRCSAEQGRRIAVVKVDITNHGTGSLGQPYIEVKAHCHGEEEVLRIDNFPWPPPKEARYTAAIVALPFFSGREPEMLWIGDKKATKLWLPHQ